ncbi:hypothetical protein TNCT_509251 [Trichonephila clavata]|uniref:Uncharacterized protein n=1 Tax=Trichonephila clavata TaxID=2740835 RepID=A0A8X6FKE1_TRICU|nr:hypothetical protein TNCT_509251 [Trichonephila clavata]
MKSIEDSRRYIVSELTPCPVKDCLHNLTAKTLRIRLATGSDSKLAVPNLESIKTQLKTNIPLNYLIKRQRKTLDRSPQFQ